MSTPNFEEPSTDAIRVLRLLKQHHNVLISGPPSTGKSRLLAEVRHWFRQTPTLAFSATGANAFPANEYLDDMEEWLPSPDRENRQVWSVTFHQGTKYRDFISGLVPSVTPGHGAFTVTHGPFYLAAAHARTATGAALVQVDEINRGPAVAIFGDTITALENDKRLSPEGTLNPMAACFRALNAQGALEDNFLPFHLYLVASMNEADTSVEPLDVAFLRRFAPFRLVPDEQALRAYLGISTPAAPLPEDPATKEQVYEAAVRAWLKVNEKIALARGPEFQLGHGVFMHADAAALPQDLPQALAAIAGVWSRITAHVREVFFGDTRGQAEVLQANRAGSPYLLHESFFADSPVYRLEGPEAVQPDGVYAVLRSVAQEG